MARFDVHPFGEYGADYLLNVQAEYLDSLETRICIPLVAQSKSRNQGYPKLKPVLNILSKKYVLMTSDMSVMFAKDLRKPVANLDDQRHEIIDSIDFLLQGF